jgi:hypothetical protein
VSEIRSSGLKSAWVMCDELNDEPHTCSLFLIQGNNPADQAAFGLEMELREDNSMSYDLAPLDGILRLSFALKKVDGST